MPIKDPIKRREYHRMSSKRWRENNIERAKANERAYHARNKVKRNAKNKEYRDNNKAYWKEKFRAWRDKNLDHDRDRNRKFYSENKDEERRKTDEWASKNRHKKRQHGHAYRARKIGATVGDQSIISSWELSWKSSQSVRCYWCMNSFHPSKCQTDHIDSIFSRGAHSIENLCISCSKCNQRKNRASISDWNKRISQPVLL